MKTLRLFYVIGFLRGLYLYLPIFTVYLTSKSIGLEWIVFAQTFYSVLQFAMEIPTGLFADRFGQRLSMVIGFFIEALGILSVVFFPNVFGLCLCYAIGGLAAAFLSGSEEALFYENATRDKVAHGPAYGRYLSNQTIGMVAATAFGGLVFAWWGVAASIPLLIGTSVALFLCAFLASFVCDVVASTASKREGSTMGKTLRKAFDTIKREDLLRTMTIVFTLIISGEYFLYNAYQPIFEETQVPAFWFGLAISCGLALNALVTRHIHRLEKYLTLERILVIISLLMAVGYLVLWISSSAIVSILAVILILGFVESYRPIVSDFLNERIESDTRVTVLSGMSFAQRVANAILRVLLTFTIAWGGMRAGVLFQGIYLILGAVLSYWLLIRCGCAHRINKHQPVYAVEHAPG